VTKRFLASDLRWPGGTPPDILLTRTIYQGVRFVVFPEIWDQVGHMLELGLDVAPVLAKESGDPTQYTDWFGSDWMKPRVHWFIGNEMDGVDEGSSWVMDSAEFGDLWQASRVLNGERWIGGMSSGDVGRARPYLQPDAAGLAVHIYTLDPTAARNKVREYQFNLKTKVWVGETHPADGFRMADYTWPSGVNVNDFAYSEAMVETMGLFA
jgi:hypothetical protein